jgi:hypothetical protein
MSRGDNYGLSETELAALVEGQIATNQAVQELARTIAVRDGVALDEPPQPQPGRPRQKRLRRCRVSRDGNGDLVGEEIDSAGAAIRPPAPEAEPAPEAAPADFSDVFGSLEGT